MPSRPHSAAFLAVRTALLALDDVDRRPIARLFGAMQVPEADLTPGTIALLRTIADLDDADLLRFGRWFWRYLSRWGDVPSAAKHFIESGASRGHREIAWQCAQSWSTIAGA